MPIYEYQCKDCKIVFEAIVNASTPTEEIACKKCGNNNIRKTISAASYRVSSSGSSIPAGALSGCSSKSGFS
ncbi:zinc ribbon domain-containing protein [Thermodesulfobacteriota bacterium]